MNLLLDTHAFLWYLSGNDPLSEAATREIERTENQVSISIVSYFEIAIKLKIGKLNLDIPYSELPVYAESVRLKGIEMTFADTERYLSLPLHHRDPFDRLLAAQALNRNLTLLSRDAAFDAYGVMRLWS